MKKRTFLLSFLVALFMSPVSAGQFSTLSDVKVLKTEHFDFIYSPKSEKTAEVLFSCAEAYYDQISKTLSTDVELHLPVVITPESDALNGYFTTVPYNRIVLFDTLPSGNFAVFSESIKSVFYHELTHAISLNMNDKAWRVMADIFGDVLSPAMFLNGTTAIAESVTVSLESLGNDVLPLNEGRLNDPFSLHILSQSKIEGKFPRWEDISGSRDAYPAGKLPYIYGGAFARYLQKTYGDEKYSDFWKAMGTTEFFRLYPGILKQVYEKNINDLWDEFYESIPVPGSVEDSSVVLSTDQMFSSLSSSDSGIIVWNDTTSGSVFVKDDDGKSKKLFSSPLGNRVAIDKEARYIAVSGTVGFDKPKNLTEVYAFDASKKKGGKKQVSLPGLKDSSIAYLEDTPFVCGIETESQFASLLVYDFDGKKVDRLSFPMFAIPLNPVYCGDDSIAFLLYYNNEWSIGLYSLQTKKCSIFKTPLVLQNLSVVKDTLYFSCAEPVKNTEYNAQNFPFWGSVSARDLVASARGGVTGGFAGDRVSDPLWSGEVRSIQAYLNLYNKKISGGVYNPLVIDNELFFVGHFFEEYKFLSREKPLKSDKKVYVKPSVDKLWINSLETVGLPTAMKDIAYNPVQFWKDGIFIPLGTGMMQQSSFAFQKPFAIPVGATWGTCDPAEAMLFRFSAGANFVLSDNAASLKSLPKEVPVFGAFSLSMASINTIEHSWAFDIDTLFSKDSPYLVDALLSFKKLKPIGSSYWKISVDKKINYFYGASLQSPMSILSFEKQKGDQCSAFLTLLNIQGVWSKRTGGAPSDFLAFSLGHEVSFVFDVIPAKIGYSVAFSGGITLPNLIPIDNKRGLVYNLPISTLLRGFLPVGVYDKSLPAKDCKLGDWTSTLVLFSVDIQHGLPYVHTYFKRFTIDAGCDGIVYRDFRTELTVHSSIYTQMCLDFGSFQHAVVKVGVNFFWNPMKKTSDVIKITAKFTL